MTNPNSPRAIAHIHVYDFPMTDERDNTYVMHSDTPVTFAVYENLFQHTYYATHSYAGTKPHIYEETFSKVKHSIDMAMSEMWERRFKYYKDNISLLSILNQFKPAKPKSIVPDNDPIAIRHIHKGDKLIGTLVGIKRKNSIFMGWSKVHKGDLGRRIEGVNHAYQRALNIYDSYYMDTGTYNKNRMPESLYREVIKPVSYRLVADGEGEALVTFRTYKQSMQSYCTSKFETQDVVWCLPSIAGNPY